MKTLTELMELVESLAKICVDSACAQSAEELTEYIGKSRAFKDAIQTALAEVFAERDAAIAERDSLKEILSNVKGLSKAYPLDIFPEPDFNHVNEVLIKHRIAPDLISASNMRNVLTRVEKMIDAAMKGTS
jgi:hypothetical protein